MILPNRRAACHGREMTDGPPRLRPRTAAVTAEFAVILPVVAALIVLLLGLGSAVGTHVSCQDAAAAGARVLLSTPSLLEGGQDDAARAAALRVAPDGSRVSFDRSGGVVRLTLSCPVGAGRIRILPARVQARAAVEVPLAERAMTGRTTG